jgi:hypothetical protein
MKTCETAGLETCATSSHSRRHCDFVVAERESAQTLPDRNPFEDRGAGRLPDHTAATASSVAQTFLSAAPCQVPTHFSPSNGPAGMKTCETAGLETCATSLGRQNRLPEIGDVPWPWSSQYTLIAVLCGSGASCHLYEGDVPGPRERQILQHSLDIVM